MKIYRIYNQKGFHVGIRFYCPFCRTWHHYTEHWKEICPKWDGIDVYFSHLYYHKDGDIVGYFGVEKGEIKFVAGDLEMEGVESISYPLLHYL